MKDRLRHYWDMMRANLWFVPLLMGIAAVALAVLLLTRRDLLPKSVVQLWLIYSGDPDSARQLMGAMLSGIITMTSLVVSITVVVLTLAAGQLGPRLVRNFISDPQTQAVLGLFVATVLYLLVVFRSVNGPAGTGVPHLAVSVGTLLTALCLFVLLFFVHKLARSIVSDNVVRDVTNDLFGAIRQRLSSGDDGAPDDPPQRPDGAAWIGLERDGYVEAVDFTALVGAARAADAVLWMVVRPGHFVLSRGEHVAVHPSDACTDSLREAVRSAFIVGDERTPTQDLEYGIRQLVEIASRALSPGINDVFTAIAVIDNLTAALGRIYDAPLEPRTLRDDKGAPRLVRDVSDHDGLVRAAFDQIRQSGGGMPAVLIRMAEGIGRLAPYARTAAQRRPLLEQLALIEAAGDRGVAEDRDRDDLRRRCEEARMRLTAMAVRAPAG